MSVRVLAKVWESSVGGGSELLALLALADWSDDEGRCFPAMKSIAKKIRLSRSQAQRVIHILIDLEYVRIIGNEYGGRPGSSRVYQVVIENLRGSARATGSVNATGKLDAQHGSYFATKRGSSHATLTVKEPSITISNIELPIWVPVAEWGAFIEHRKKLKKPLTQYSMNLAIKQLNRIVETGHKAEEVINEAILRGWLSFYPLKADPLVSNNIMEGVS